ncbi:hypothetical protein U14_06010 [Candidatus Moduliflexus flocculans]|uniref:Uncharacterized protein n=1 Tax=Candidatus Moduliflexus flocculans TaxID=1499966 RepID=A0A081BTJ1_9BACT|nr:hypothetical protein U14_06010 [Candidatus Moduliflexus flocculans]
MWQAAKSLYLKLVRQWLRFYSRKVSHRTRIELRATSASDVLKYAGTWAGDDLEDCVTKAISSRAELRF